MLTSSILFSTYRPAVVPANLPNKDINIFEHSLEPVPKLDTSYKKSSTNPNCLAVSATHIYAAQADKAVVQVYNREKGTKEADVPFGEKIASCCFVESRDRDGVGVLVLGMDGGRLIIWEVCTGRQVSTPAAHLEAVTCLAIDPTNNFLFSGSQDNNIHVWRLANLLSFSTESRVPDGTFSEHRGAITSLVVSHSKLGNSFILSASEDKTVLLWNFRNTTRLVTFLTSSIPRCLAIDPADRSFYIASEESVQFVDLYGISFSGTQEAIELGDTQKWSNEDAILCLDVNFDGTHLLTGHANGKVFRRTTPRGQSVLVYDAHLPISNIIPLNPTGFVTQEVPATKASIVKPKLDLANRKEEGLLPERYEFNSTFVSALHSQNEDDSLFADFDALLEHASFPDSLIFAPLTTLPKHKATDLDEAAAEVIAKLQREHQALATDTNKLKLELERLRQEQMDRQRNKKLNRIRKARAFEAMRRKNTGLQNGAMELDEDNVQAENVSSDTDD